MLLLPAVDDALAEQPVLVANAITVSGDAQGRHAFHKARSQSAQAAVAQGRVGLQQADAFQVYAQLGQRLTCDVEQAQIAQAVVEQTADQKLQRQVVHPLLVFAINLPGMVHPVLDHMVAGGQCNGFKPVMVKRVIRVFTHRVSQFGQYSVTKSRYLRVTNKRFLGHRYNLWRDGAIRRTNGVSLDRSTGTTRVDSGFFLLKTDEMNSAPKRCTPPAKRFNAHFVQKTGKW